MFTTKIVGGYVLILPRPPPKVKLFRRIIFLFKKLSTPATYGNRQRGLTTQAEIPCSSSPHNCKALSLENQGGLTMNVTPIEKQIMALNALVEGNSIRSTERMTGLHRDTIMRLLVRIGNKCQKIMDKYLIGFHCKHMQIDEIWTYVGKKEKKLSSKDRLQGEYGDQYVFVALDADTKSSGS